MTGSAWMPASVSEYAARCPRVTSLDERARRDEPLEPATEDVRAILLRALEQLAEVAPAEDPVAPRGIDHGSPCTSGWRR